MKLTHVRVKDFRSFDGEHEFDLSNGVNYFVGPNNSGKSNLLRAIELALDPDAEYLPERDRPASAQGVGQPRVTRITLTFLLGTTSPESTLLRRAKEYEKSVKASGGTYADSREVRLVASFQGGVRQLTFGIKGAGNQRPPSDSNVHRKLEDQFWKVIRFAVIHSGEDLASLLNGKFREILHLVIEDHLGEALAEAEQAREAYLQHLQEKLLDPLRTQVRDRVVEIFPEVELAELVPDVPSVEETLSSVDVRLGDVITTGLTEKGTGVRGAVLVAMLQYLADQSRRSLVLAVEEPEAFLHPGAQEAIRHELERLAMRPDVTLIVTTHSPYVISRTADSSVTELAKGPDGTTVRGGAVSGDDPRSDLLGSLYRDAGMAAILERALEIPATAKGVVITEGITDGLFIKAGCEAAGKSALTDGWHVIPAHGTKGMIVQAVLAASATDLPVVALLDFDDNGRRAAKQLEEAFHWSKKKEILSLNEWPEKCKFGHEVEIEDLIPASVTDQLVKRLTEDVAVTAKLKCKSGAWHYDFSAAWKDEAMTALPGLLSPESASGLVWVAEEVNRRLDTVAKAKDAKAARSR